ncbi:amidohydrolase family protein [Marinibaculum pumilum]|uniref:Amidohydrolase family protein n=1 Tax=Marinibaculum pumilum TaxID=1766165 RepID=A0ABV7KV19_9PROT
MTLYDGPIIDAHTHLWDLSMDRHPWLRPGDGAVQALGGLERLQRDYVVADYLRDSANQPIAASVHVEALWSPDDLLGESRWLDGLDKSRGVAAAYVGAAPLGTPAAAAVIEAQAAFGRMTGIRGILSFHPTLPEKSFAAADGLADDPAWRADLARLARTGLNFEVMLYPYQAAGLAGLARALPELRIVVNHCASPVDRDPDGMARWRQAVTLLAAEPNIRIKVSNAEGYDPAPTEESLRLVQLHCIESFGPARSMLATDWPVAGLTNGLDTAGFDAIWDRFRRLLVDFSPDEQRAMFHDNAQALYRI